MKNENENLLRIVMKCSLSVSQRDLVIKTKRDNEEIEVTIMAIMFRGHAVGKWELGTSAPPLIR